MSPEGKTSRREWLASLAMGVGLAAAYGVLAVQALLFLLPRQLGARTRPLFAGLISHFPVGGVKAVYDLQGNEILVRRTSQSDFQAFSSTCPHLGCKVHWVEEDRHYLCPCHRGIFDADGVAVSGPPADGGQNMIPVPLRVDEESGVVYIEVKRR